MFDFDSLTIGEVAFIEDLSGLSIAQISDEAAPKGKALAAMVTVAKRRNGEPGFKFNDALNVPMSEVNALLGFGEEVTEEEGEDDASDENERA